MIPVVEGPGAIAHSEGSLLTPDGLRLFWQRFEPAEPRGVLLLVHGLGEHQNPWLRAGDRVGR